MIPDDGDGDSDGPSIDFDSLPDADLVDPDNIIDERDFDTGRFIQGTKIKPEDTLKSLDELLAGSGIDVRNPAEQQQEFIDKIKDWSSSGPFLPDATDEEELYTGATDFIKDSIIDRLGQATDQNPTAEFIDQIKSNTDFLTHATDQVKEVNPDIFKPDVSSMTNMVKDSYVKTTEQLTVKPEINSFYDCDSEGITTKAPTTKLVTANVLNTKILTQPLVNAQQTTTTQNLQVQTLTRFKNYNTNVYTGR